MLPTLGVTPYGAVQFQDFYTPAYSESDVGGGGFGLSYASTNATDVRTELGSRFDAPTIVYGKPVILYGRLDWAHDFVNAPSMNASFQALPGSSFTVTGAPIANELGTHHRRRPSLLHAELVFARQVRRRIRQRLPDLRRLRHGTLYLVSEQRRSEQSRSPARANLSPRMIRTVDCAIVHKANGDRPAGHRAAHPGGEMQRCAALQRLIDGVAIDVAHRGRHAVT